MLARPARLDDRYLADDSVGVLGFDCPQMLGVLAEVVIELTTQFVGSAPDFVHNVTITFHDDSSSGSNWCGVTRRGVCTPIAWLIISRRWNLLTFARCRQFQVNR